VNREENRNGQRETVSKEWIDCLTTGSVSSWSVGRTPTEQAASKTQAGLLFVLGMCLMGFCWSGIARGEEQPEAADGREQSLTAMDVAGVTHRIPSDKPSVATVVVFLLLPGGHENPTTTASLDYEQSQSDSDETIRRIRNRIW